MMRVADRAVGSVTWWLRRYSPGSRGIASAAESSVAAIRAWMAVSWDRLCPSTGRWDSRRPVSIGGADRRRTGRWWQPVAGAVRDHRGSVRRRPDRSVAVAIGRRPLAVFRRPLGVATTCQVFGPADGGQRAVRSRAHRPPA